MAISQAKSKILPLTSARFFAALYVMLHHTLPKGAVQTDWQEWITRFIGMGYVGVSFFFMLSGFILSIVYLSDNQPINKRRFFIARFARVYPLYFIAMLLDTPHFLHIERMVFKNSWLKIATEYGATTGLVQAWLGLRSLNPPGWSLSAEAFFYLCFPFLGVTLWRLRTRFVPYAAVIIFTSSILFVMLLDHVHGTNEQSYYPLPHLFIFMLGVLLAKSFIWIQQDPINSQRLKMAAPWMLLSCLAALLAISMTRVTHYESQLQHGLLAPLFGAAILCFASGNQIVVSHFSKKWLVVLGEASYALYLLHYPIHSILRREIERFGTPMFILYLLGTIGLSVASYYWVEHPVRRWILTKERVHNIQTQLTSSLSQ